MGLRSRLMRWASRRKAPPGADGASSVNSGADYGRHLAEGLQHFRSGQLEAAARAFNRSIEAKHDEATAHSLLGQVHRARGQLEDAVDCLYLAAHFEPASAEIHVELSAALRALGRTEEAEVACRRAAELAPWLPEAAFERANLAKSRGELELAVSGYRDVLRLKHDYVPALCNLGYTLRLLGRFAEAQRELELALRHDPSLAEARHNLGLVLREQGHFAEALACFEKVVELRPDLLESKSSMAHCLADLGRGDDAMAVYGDVLARAPDLGDAIINRCYAYLQAGDYEAGWAEYERRFSATQTSPRAFPFAPWRGEPLSGRTILVYAEQGLGDEIMFASCLPDLLARGGRCVLECSSRLAPLFRRSFPSALVHGGGKSDPTDWLTKFGTVDFQTPIGSLPRYLRPSAESFPKNGGYLVPDTQRADRWRSKLATLSGRKVGISWRGGTPATRGFLRSIPAAVLAKALGRYGVTLVSLQHGNVASEVAEARAASGVEIIELSDATTDIEDQAAVLSVLDLIVSVDNTVVHLAGALGRPVWVLLSAAPEWRYPRVGSTMPWYSSARLFHQRRPCVWESALGDLRAALDEWVDRVDAL